MQDSKVTGLRTKMGHRALCLKPLPCRILTDKTPFSFRSSWSRFVNRFWLLMPDKFVTASVLAGVGPGALSSSL